jgi:hypothetical protein
MLWSRIAVLAADMWTVVPLLRHQEVRHRYRHPQKHHTGWEGSQLASSTFGTSSAEKRCCVGAALEPGPFMYMQGLDTMRCASSQALMQSNWVERTSNPSLSRSGWNGGCVFSQAKAKNASETHVSIQSNSCSARRVLRAPSQQAVVKERFMVRLELARDMFGYLASRPSR